MSLPERHSHSMDAALWGDDPAHYRAQPDERTLANHRAHIDGRVDPRLHIVPHDHAELPPPRVHVLPLVRYVDVLLVQPQVGNLRPRPEVAPLPEDGIAHVVQVGHVAPIHDDGVLHLRSVPHLAAIPDVRARANEAVRADLRVLPDDGRPLDVRARVNLRALADAHLANQACAFLDLALDFPFQARQVDLVRAQQVPGAADGHPPPGQPLGGQPPGPP